MALLIYRTASSVSWNVSSFENKERKREENDRRRKRRRSKPAFAFTVTYEEEGEDPVDGLTLPFYSEEAPLEPRNNWTVNQEYMHVHVIVVEHIIPHNYKR